MYVPCTAFYIAISFHASRVCFLHSSITGRASLTSLFIHPHHFLTFFIFFLPFLKNIFFGVSHVESKVRAIHLFSLFAHTHLNCTRSFYHHHHHLAAHGGVYPLSVVVLSAAGAIRWQHHARIIERRSSSSFFSLFASVKGQLDGPLAMAPI